MTTKTVDNIISKSIQEIANDYVASKYDYVEPRENPIALRDSVKQDAIRLFKNDLGFNVSVVMRGEEPWFVAKDVASCIEYSNVTKMCELCRDKDKIVVNIDDLKTNDLLVLGNRGLTCVSESGLYRIFAKCNLPKCEPFESWVFDEVLPSIRKTGSYSIIQTQPTIYDYARALIAEKERSDALKAQNKALQAERDEALHAESLAKEASDRLHIQSAS